MHRLYERNGALEISVRPASGRAEEGADVVWRVRMLALSDDAIVVEQPAVFGEGVDIRPGVELIGAMTVGQNRWMFHTRVLAVKPGPDGDRLVLKMPELVERCTRRGFFRISTAELRLPAVQCWPLNDPLSVIAAETANRIRITDMMEGDGPATTEAGESAENILLPDVGPAFTSRLLNLSGGGLGLLVNHEDIQTATARPYLWIRMDLRPLIPEPVAVTARIAHSHIDSTQSLYLGLAFDFAANPGHRQFVADLFGEYLHELQRRQSRLGLKAA
ncbi:MAG: hypothetical protein KF869_12175 [Phycisphaeraceae bacterium]|nr:hypothetical protein [Phycisphaeraceae bacterium]